MIAVSPAVPGDAEGSPARPCASTKRIVPIAYRCELRNDPRQRKDTLFAGGPGATGRSYSDFPTILRSICERLGTLPGETIVHTGHGDSTNVGDEIVHYEEWVARGH